VRLDIHAVPAPDFKYPTSPNLETSGGLAFFVVPTTDLNIHLAIWQKSEKPDASRLQYPSEAEPAISSEGQSITLLSTSGLDFGEQANQKA
jgi:hypothetical protein